MDWFSHGMIPLAFVWLARGDRRQRAAAAVGGLAPDLDAFFGWIPALVPQLYALGHRGVSHTIWGAPLMGLGVWWLLTRPRVYHRWAGPEAARPAATRPVILCLLFGAGLHLVLDGITITGAPILWPLVPDRISLNAHFFILPSMAIVSGVAWIQVLRRRMTRRGIRTTLALLLTILALSGLVRAATIPNQPGPQSHRTPGPLEWQWTLNTPDADGIHVTSYSWGTPTTTSYFPHQNATEAAAAIGACQSLSAYTGWRWHLWGLPVLNATADENAWNVTIHDSAQRHAQETQPALFQRPGGDDDDEAFRCRVDPDGTAHAVSS